MSEQTKILNPASFNLSPGKMIAGRYCLEEKIGAGGVGMVYRARDLDLSSEMVAIKLLQPHLADDENIFKRFRNEVLVARTLTHPNIVRTHDIGRDTEGFSYISMEYVRGESLKDLLQKTKNSNKNLDFKLALDILLQIISGVSYAHEKGVIHRDLKPGNVLIHHQDAKGSYEVKLADFGTARILGMDMTLTETGQVIGTPDYMAPEQIRGEALDCRCDIYSLGIIAYELVSGKRPFFADTPVALAYKHISEKVPEIELAPAWYNSLIQKATAKKKEDRYQTVLEMAEAIWEEMPELNLQGSQISKKRNSTSLDRLSDIEPEWKLGELTSSSSISRNLPKVSSANLKLALFLLTILSISLISSLFLFRPDLLNYKLVSLSNGSVSKNKTEIEKLESELLMTSPEREVVAEKKDDIPLEAKTEVKNIVTPVSIPVISLPSPTTTITIPASYKVTKGFTFRKAGNLVLNYQLSKSNLSMLNWSIPIEVQGTEEKSAQVFSVNIVDASAGKLLQRIIPEDMEKTDSEIILNGKIDNFEQEQLAGNILRFDLLKKGELLHSQELNLIDSFEKEEKKEIANEVIVKEDIAKVEEKFTNSLPVAKGHEKEYEMGQSITTTTIAKLPNEEFVGFLNFPTSATNSSSTRLPISLSLEFSANQISGQAEIDTFGSFTVKGKVLARGIELELQSEKHWLRLTSGLKEKGMKGLANFPEIGQRGSWEVVQK